MLPAAAGQNFWRDLSSILSTAAASARPAAKGTHARTRTSDANRQNEHRSKKRHEGARGQSEAAPTWRGRWPRRLCMTIGAEAGGSGFIS